MRVEGWTPAKLGDFAWEPTERAPVDAEVLSVTKHRGFVPSLEYFGKQVFSKDTDSYKLVRRGQFAYATIHLDEGSIDYLKDRDHGTISPMYTVFDVDDRRVDRSFLLELLRTPVMLERYAAIGQGSINRRKSIVFEALANETLLLPPLPEQKKIAAIISSVDEAIQATQLVIDQTRRVKEGLLQDLLTRGLPGHRRFKQTEIGEIPESWEVLRLDRISPSLSVGLVINPSTYFAEDGTVPMLVGSNIKEDGIDWSGVRRISTADNKALGSTQIYKGDLVTVRVGNPGLTLVVPPELDGSNCASIMIVRRHEHFDSNWLCAALNSRQGKRQFAAVQYGTAQKQFNISHAVKFKFAVPPLAEQRAIAALTATMNEQTRVSEGALSKLQRVKAGLLQDLLTGKVRVSP